MNKQVPKVRFEGFSGEWRKFKFIECFDFPVSTNSLPRAMLNYNEGEIKSIHYGDILIKYPSILNIKKNKIPYITDGKLEKYNSNLLGNGDLVFADAAEDETVGKAVEVSGITDENLVAGLHTIVARAKEKKAKYFLAYYINSDIYHRQLVRLMQGSKISAISKGNLQKTLVTFPDDIEEQSKIGYFFKQLDDTINLKQQELDTLKQTKQGFLQKMFPKEGETVPEVRFEGFSGKWEERIFFDNILKTIDFRGRTPKKLGFEWSEEGYLALSALNVKKGYIDFTTEAHYGSQELYEKWMDGNELEKGQVLFTTEAPMGNVAQVPDDSKYILSQRTIAFTVAQNKMTNDFLATILSSPKTFNELTSLSSGGTAKGISQKSLSKFKVTVPINLQEQSKIGSFFKQLDDTIALHQRELEVLKETKQAFLQKMFV